MSVVLSSLLAVLCSPVVSITHPVASLEAIVQLTEEEVSRRDAVSRKADQIELHRVATQKADIGHVKEALHHKADRSAVDSLKARQAVNSDIVGRIACLQDDIKGKACIQVSASSLVQAIFKFNSVAKHSGSGLPQADNNARIPSHNH